MTAREARRIRRGCRARSANRDHMGVSEWFSAPPADRRVLESVSDPRLLMWLLGFSRLPSGELAALRARGLNWAA